MSYWSIYISKKEEKLLRKPIETIAKKNRWSFSQAVSGILRQHLIEEKKRLSDEDNWQKLTTQAFFEDDEEKDSIYDTL
ncbi:MAG: hypothetical protein A3G32_01355 [Deltaproteobacteria bacterium RIFCSPLOWO2_12_FULL_40_28]|nr:MAG: hypothetical protein A3C45_10240 [Deltaproteobacteria bacterium RIFCSPHIGHO2_02_FULL_40_28]OGQ19975.1 MAG: hypothetical protein A3E27_07190 [Deltaproteobacteria bacterium RIFCSPHIGHO2_12_FULL_40_32]OGQ39735.1 MAG: hypothetical protein A3I69_06620 [Deltaproteobacteria bacterium RIFCSPLOWO2_02_FULL_40_36]OGQ52990.1 MAG: hypothetical protein A3G32_01355 [Deltaproteobacteria bacterium RIFCSPLOWO2_12_FULL_40_28]